MRARPRIPGSRPGPAARGLRPAGPGRIRPAARLRGRLVPAAALLAGLIPAALPARAAGDPAAVPAVVPALAGAAADPWEPFNRRLFETGGTFDRVLLDPAVSLWKATVPEAARRGIAGTYRTLDEPRNLANALLQGRIRSAFRALDRLLVNGVLGVGGLADHATALGLAEERHDFGQTLAAWGVPSGPFVIAPVIGPSTVRDAAGFVVDFLANPVRWAERALLSGPASAAERAIELVARRAVPDREDWRAEAFAGAPDPYRAMRAAWLAARARALLHLPPAAPGPAGMDGPARPVPLAEKAGGGEGRRPAQGGHPLGRQPPESHATPGPAAPDGACGHLEGARATPAAPEGPAGPD